MERLSQWKNFIFGQTSFCHFIGVSEPCLKQQMARPMPEFLGNFIFNIDDISIIPKLLAYYQYSLVQICT